MVTNNFEQIRSLLNFKDDYFYFIQIIQRKKEHPELGKNNRVIRSYNISSMDKYDANIKEIITMCETFNARAYIHLNRRKWSQISLECLRHNAHLIANGQYDGIKSSLETIIGRICGEPKETKTWIIDIDGQEFPSPIMMANIDHKYRPLGVAKCIAVIPTKNGCHLITKPFDVQVFKELYPDVDIHKDNPTVLYA